VSAISRASIVLSRVLVAGLWGGAVMLLVSGARSVSDRSVGA
jgi:hypothetical protein